MNIDVYTEFEIGDQIVLRGPAGPIIGEILGTEPCSFCEEGWHYQLSDDKLPHMPTPISAGVMKRWAVKIPTE